MRTKIKDEEVNNNYVENNSELPMISFNKQKKSFDFVIESFDIVVRGKSLKECHKVFCSLKAELFDDVK